MFTCLNLEVQLTLSLDEVVIVVFQIEQQKARGEHFSLMSEFTHSAIRQENLLLLLWPPYHD